MAVTPAVKKVFKQFMRQLQRGGRPDVPPTLLDRPNQIVFPTLHDSDEEQAAFLDALDGIPSVENEELRTLGLDVAAMGPDALEDGNAATLMAPTEQEMRAAAMGPGGAPAMADMGPESESTRANPRLSEKGEQRLSSIVRRARERRNRPDAPPPLDL